MSAYASDYVNFAARVADAVTATIADHGTTVVEVAEAAGISRLTLERRLAAPEDFYLDELGKLGLALTGDAWEFLLVE